MSDKKDRKPYEATDEEVIAALKEYFSKVLKIFVHFFEKQKN